MQLLQYRPNPMWFIPNIWLEHFKNGIASMATKDESPLKAYKQARQLEEVDKAKAEKLLKYYDSIRVAAAKHDAATVNELLSVLENSLNYEVAPVLCWRLQKLYLHIRQCVQAGDFREACRVADQLYAMWQQGAATL